MHIQYYGLSAIKLTFKEGKRSDSEVTLYINPHDIEEGVRAVRGQAQVLVSNIGAIPQESREHFSEEVVVLDMPGEYAVSGMTIEAPQVKTQHSVTIIDLPGGVRLTHLGRIAEIPDNKLIEQIDGTDILCVPVGGHDVLTPEQAVTLTQKISPSVVIPTVYQLNSMGKEYRDVEEFCKQLGTCLKQYPNKLALKKKELEEKDMEIAHLASLR